MPIKCVKNIPITIGDADHDPHNQHNSQSMAEFFQAFIPHCFLRSLFFGINQFVMVYDHAPYYTACLPNSQLPWEVLKDMSENEIVRNIKPLLVYV